MAISVPKNILLIGNELAILWDDGREDYFPLEKLRRECPCAMCRGEKDLLGKVYRGPDRPLTARAFEATAHRLVGSYAVQIEWADGHNDGIYSFEGLRHMAEKA